MEFYPWVNEKIKKLKYWDVLFIKFSVMWFTLMIAKLWEPIISFDWYWYMLFFVLFAIKPLITVFGK